jgi:hypothetical protein
MGREPSSQIVGLHEPDPREQRLDSDRDSDENRSKQEQQQASNLPSRQHSSHADTCEYDSTDDGGEFERLEGLGPHERRVHTIG